MKIKIERKIFGSLVNRQADTVLEYTENTSSDGNYYGRMLSDPNNELSDCYAAFVLKPGLYGQNILFIHFQGGHVSFPSNGRYYTTRAIYEVSTIEMEKINYSFSSLLPSIPRMQRWESSSWGTSPEVEIPQLKSVNIKDLTDDEKKLYVILLDNLVNHNCRQLFIALTNDGGQYYENGAIDSFRLASLVKVIDCLPTDLRKRATLAFSVDGAVHELFENALIVAYQQGVPNQVVTKAGVVVDWTQEHIDFGSVEIPDIALIDEFEQLLAMLPVFPELSTDSQVSVFKIPALVKDKIETAIKEGDAQVLLQIFKKGKTAYQHKIVSVSLSELISDGKADTDITIDDILQVYPDIITNKKVQQYLKDIICASSSLSVLNGLFQKYDSQELRKVAIDTLQEKYIDWIAQIKQSESDAGYEELLENAHDAIIKEKNNWSNAVKISMLRCAYFGITIEDIEIENWIDCAEFCDAIASDENAEDIMSQILSHSETWNRNDLNKSIFEKIRRYIQPEKMKNLRKSVVEEYLLRGSYDWIFSQEHITSEEVTSLLDRQDDYCVCDLIDKIRQKDINGLDWNGDSTVKYRNRYLQIKLSQSILLTDVEWALGQKYDLLTVNTLEHCRKSTTDDIVAMLNNLKSLHVRNQFREDVCCWINDHIAKIKFTFARYCEFLSQIDFYEAYLKYDLNNITDLGENYQEALQSVVSSRFYEDLMKRLDCMYDERVAGNFDVLLTEIKDRSDNLKFVTKNNLKQLFCDILSVVRYRNAIDGNELVKEHLEQLNVLDLFEERANEIISLNVNKWIKNPETVEELKFQLDYKAFNAPQDNEKALDKIFSKLSKSTKSQLYEKLKEYCVNDTNKNNSIAVQVLQHVSPGNIVLKLYNKLVGGIKAIFKKKINQVMFLGAIAIIVGAICFFPGIFVNNDKEPSNNVVAAVVSDSIVSNSIEHTLIAEMRFDSITVQLMDNDSVHIISKIRELVKDSLYKTIPAIGVSIGDSVFEKIDISATDNVDFQTIDSIYYAQKQAEDFISVTVISEQDTVVIDYSNSLLSYCEEKQQQSVLSLIVASDTVNVDNESYAAKSQKACNLNQATYYFWITEQIDSILQYKKETKLVAY